MKEGKFIDQNEKKWDSIEEKLSKGYYPPEESSQHLGQSIADLGFAKTRYSYSWIGKYLNGLTGQLFLKLNSQKPLSAADIAKFWTYELPKLFWQNRNYLFASTIVFTISVLIGVLSSIYDPDFAEFILGPDYIAMTLENIEKGDPMAVYKKEDPFEMFLFIGFNNLRVASLTFLGGVFSVIGGAVILLYNGIMVGAFQWFFVGKGLFVDSFLTIWMHGAIEIPAIVIIGTAGLKLGYSMVAPGTFSRLRSVQIAAWACLKMYLGVFPLIVFAAFIESFLTRFTELPNILRILVIGFSFFFMFFYFYYLPRKLFKGDKKASNEDGNFSFGRQASDGESNHNRFQSLDIYRLAIRSYVKNFSLIWWRISPITIVSVLIYELTRDNQEVIQDWEWEMSVFEQYNEWLYLLDWQNFPVIVMLQGVVLVVLARVITVRMNLKDKEKPFFRWLAVGYIGFQLIVFYWFFMSSVFGMLSGFLGIGFVFLVLVNYSIEGSLTKSFNQSMSMVFSSSVYKLLGASFIALVTFGIVGYLVEGGLVGYYDTLMSVFVDMRDQNVAMVWQVLFKYLHLTFFYSILALFLLTILFFVKARNEFELSTQLFKRIEALSKHKMAYGLEKEA